MNKTRAHRSLKSRVTGFHIAILFSAAVWFGLFKILNAQAIANGVIWFTLIVIIALEIYLASAHRRRQSKSEIQIDVVAD